MLDIRCKVGSVGRAPCQTSPLHRRFAWQWWFLPLGDDPAWMLEPFLARLCARDEVAWGAIEGGDAENDGKVTRLEARLFDYRFTRPGEGDDWWVREDVELVRALDCGDP